MYHFDPATAEGGFPVELQGLSLGNVNLSRNVGGQFFGGVDADFPTLAKDYRVWAVAGVVGVLGYMAGMAMERRRGL